MPDLIFSDAELAALYDRMNPGRADFDFYMPMIMSAGSVLDVGCGTGAMLHEARRTGHNGRLCGLDPADGMLEQARKWTDIEWISGDLTSVAWAEEFDLVVMTGHAFQVFLKDAELQAALQTIRIALSSGGRFAFETRNPLARAWERWGGEERPAGYDANGAPVLMKRSITKPFDGRLISFAHTFQSAAWRAPRVSHSTLRFLDKSALNAALAEAEFAIEAQFGDWDSSPFTDTSPEIITVARRA